MIRLLIIGLFAVHCNAFGNIIGFGGTGGGFGGELDSGLGMGFFDGIGVSNGIGGGRVKGAVYSTRTIHTVPVPSNVGSAVPTVVDIDPSEQPLVLNFNSRSSPLLATQAHYGQPGSVQYSSAVDEPHTLVRDIVRPVIQEVREVIAPYRNVRQEIRPVIENIHTVVARGVGGVGGRGGSFGVSDRGMGFDSTGMIGGYGGGHKVGFGVSEKGIGFGDIGITRAYSGGRRDGYTVYDNYGGYVEDVQRLGGMGGYRTLFDNK